MENECQTTLLSVIFIQIFKRYYLFQKARSIDESFMDMNDVDKFIFLMAEGNIQPLLGSRQSMFVKHVPPLWAYFKEATKL